MRVLLELKINKISLALFEIPFSDNKISGCYREAQKSPAELCYRFQESMCELTELVTAGHNFEEFVRIITCKITSNVKYKLACHLPPIDRNSCQYVRNFIITVTVVVLSWRNSPDTTSPSNA